MKKLAIVTTHPIQYYAPVFKLLAKKCNLRVFYTWGESSQQEKYDPDFKQSITWDIPLLDGYEYEFLENSSKNPGSHHFSGINNPRIIQKISSFSPDAILVYGWAYKSHLKVIRHFKNKVPIWFRGDSTVLNTQKKTKRILRKIFLTWVYKHVDKAFYVGAENKVYYKTFGLRDNQLIFSPHAIDNERFSKDHSNEAKLIRESLNLKDGDLLILFAGKLEANKNPQILRDAFLEINQVNAHLLFVGNGVLEEELKASVAHSEIYASLSRIHFIDFKNQSQMPIIYQSCDLFCLPSVSETWGLAVNEAMAAGKAILVSDHVGCAKDLIKINRNGAIFETSNQEDLKEKLLFLMQDSKKLTEMGKQSAILIKDWSFQMQVNILINELNK